MANIFLALNVFLFFGSVGGSNVTQLFVQTGSGVTLDIMDPGALKDYFVLQWKFNTNKVLVSAPPNGEATVNSERVAFHPQNSSVTLKNLQKTDSGLYEVQLIKNSPVPEIISSVSISVQDPVSPVTVTVDSVSNSSESCNFTVSCTTDHFTLSHSFTCNNHSCEDQKEVHTKPTPSAASLYLYLSNVFIICNHSNQVSWTKDTRNYQQICQQAGNKGTKDQTEKSESGVYIGAVVVAALIGIFIGFVVHQRRKSQRLNMDNTVYECPQGPTPQPTSTTDVALVESPSSVYSLLGPPTGQRPAPAQAPESVYATVNKPSKP